MFGDFDSPTPVRVHRELATPPTPGERETNILLALKGGHYRD